MLWSRFFGTHIPYNVSYIVEVVLVWAPLQHALGLQSQFSHNVPHLHLLGVPAENVKGEADGCTDPQLVKRVTVTIPVASVWCEPIYAH